jgi:2',3'-cyclic-nucleotide 2'-phosphodiesterase/3'-nucleotidase
MRHHSRPAFVLAAVVAAVAATAIALLGRGASDAGDPTTITVLWTTDFHGAIRARERERNRPIGSTPILAAYLDRERARNPLGTVLLDGGDCMQGSMASNLSYGRAVIEQMNRLGYDASAIGNHEFDWSADTFAARARESRFPWLGANIYLRDGETRPAWAGESVLLERQGVRIGVVGFATVSTPSVTMPSHVAAFRFRAPASLARAAIRDLRARGADVVLVIGHLPARQSHRGGPITGELAELGAAIEGEDALLGGHSHNLVRGEVDGVPALIAGSHGRAIGRLDLTVDRRTRRVVAHRSALITTYADAIQPDPGFTAFAESLDRALRSIAGHVLCDAPRALDRDRAGESPLGNWVADVMRRAAGAEVAVHNPGGLRASIDAGPVTAEEVFEVMPFDNRLVTLELTGAEILAAVEHGLANNGCLQVSGIRYRFAPSRPRGERVLVLTLDDGTPIDHGRRFRVATNEFLADGGDGYWMIERGAALVRTDTLVREALIADCEARGRRGEPLAPARDGRIVRTEAARSRR